MGSSPSCYNPPKKIPSALTLRALHEDSTQVGQDPVAPPEPVLAQGGCPQGLGGMEQLLAEEHLPLRGEWGAVRGLQPPRGFNTSPPVPAHLGQLLDLPLQLRDAGRRRVSLGKGWSSQGRDPRGDTPSSAPQLCPEHPTSSSRRDFRPRVSSSSSISSPTSSVRRELRRRRPSSSPVISDSGRPVFLARATFSLPGHGWKRWPAAPLSTPLQGQRGRR